MDDFLTLMKNNMAGLPELTVKEWEHTKRLAQAGLKDALMSIKVNTVILNLAEEELELVKGGEENGESNNNKDD